MTTIQLYGRLYRGPEERTTGAGKPMTTAGMVVDLGRDAEMPEWISLVAFGSIGEVLSRHDKGDMVAVSGKHPNQHHGGPHDGTTPQANVLARKERT